MIKKVELKWMYQYDIEDPSFGLETDKYVWVNKVLTGRANVAEMINYFEKYYPNDERNFIDKLKELSR